MLNVYLAGPIAGLTYEQAQEWRVYAYRFLSPHNIRAYSPLRDKEFLQGRGPITLEDYGHLGQALAGDSGIVTRDKHDVRNADIMLVNLLGAPYVSCGTPVEFGWANAYNVPIVTVMEEKGSCYDHPFIRQLTGFRVETLEEGLSICVSVLT